MTEDLGVYEYLCIKDRRSPHWADLYEHEDPADVPEPRSGCYCDNCFYGRDRLAVEILRLRDELAKPIAT